MLCWWPDTMGAVRFSSLVDFHVMPDCALSMFALFVFLSGLVTPVISQGPSSWTALPFNPPALPLAVRSPYLNVWLQQGPKPAAAFSVDNRIWSYADAPSNEAVQWYASVVVDTTEYRLLSPWADGELTANQTAVEFTATRTSFLMEAGGVQFNMSFLSPIEPNNFTLQSLPFAYLYLTAQSIDGQQHRIRMYSDIEGNIAAGNVSQTITWDAEDSDDYVVLSTRLQNQRPFVEDQFQAQDATVYYAFKKIKSFTTSWTITGFNSARGRLFSDPVNGILNNQADTDFRAPSSGNNTPVFGISIDWGSISSTPEPAVWCLGVYRDPSIQYLTPEGSFQNRTPYFASSISDPLDAPKFVLDDFPRALSASQALDAQIRSDGESVSKDYADLLALSVRQVMGSMDITIPSLNGASWDTSDVKIFMKNIGGVGADNSDSSVNNVDTLYAAFPAFLYLNPDIGGYLLAPLLDYQDSSAYRLPYAAKNIGSAYPSAIADGINDQHVFGIDETAGMIIMTLAYSLASGNGTLIAKHYGLLRSWTEYLGNNTITPFNQSSGDFRTGTDPFPTIANQTNLALKGIIGIAAMAKIAEAAGETEDQQRFNASATSAITFWQNEAISASNVNFFYGATGTNVLMYNLYADKLLRLNLVPDSVYTLCTTYYQAAAGQFQYGIPLDYSLSQNTTTNWMMFAASTAKSNETRDVLISQVHAVASNNINVSPFRSIYDPRRGNVITGVASAAQGGLFALLALSTTSKSISVPGVASSQDGTSGGTSKVNAGLIAGVTIAVIVAICGIAFGVYFWRRRRLRKSQNGQPAGPGMSSLAHVTEPFILSPSNTDAYNYTGYTGSSAVGSYDPPSSSRSRSQDVARQRRESTGRLGAKYQEARGTRDQSRMMRMMARIRELESRSGASTDSGTDRLQAVETLRFELDSLRRDVERMRQERSGGEEAPPSYSDPF